MSTNSPVTFLSDQLNFFRLVLVVFDVLPDAIRPAFEHMWNTLVVTRTGFLIWDDSLQVRNQFLAEEGGKTIYVPTNKSYKEWDFTALIHATLYARSFATPRGSRETLHKKYVEPCNLPNGSFHRTVISPSGNLEQTYSLALDQLRRLRNYLCHQIGTKKIPKATFDLMMQRCKDAIRALGQGVSKVEEIEKLDGSEFPTVKLRHLEEELRKISKPIKDDIRHIKAKVDDIGSDVKTVNAGVLDMTTKMEAVGSDLRTVKAGVDDNGFLLRRMQTDIRDLSEDVEGMKQEFISFKAASTITQNPDVECNSAAAQCNSAGYIHYNNGNYEKAFQALQVASNMQLLDFAWSLGNLGAVQIRMGDFDGALESLQKALGIVRGHSWRDDRKIAAILNNLGCVYLEIDENNKTCGHDNGSKAIEEALKLLMEASEMYKRLNGSPSEAYRDAQTGSAFHNLGCAHFKLKNNKAASKAFQVAANIRSALLGEHEDTAFTHLWLGVVQLRMGAYHDALKSLQESSRIYQKIKSNSELTATSSHYLGEVYVEMNNYESALQAALTATDVNVKLFGDQHEKTAGSYHLLGVVYLRMGDLYKALENFKKASQIKNKILGEHVYTATSFSLLGLVYMKMRDNTSAVEAFRIAANMRSKLLGKDKLTAYTYYCLGKAQRQLGDLSEALICLQNAADMRSKVPNGFDEETARYYHALGLVQLDIKNWEGALESFQKAVDMRLDLLGDHEDTACSYHYLGEVQAYMLDNERATFSLKKAANIRAKLHDDSEIAACTYNNLGIVQLRIGDLNGALESLQKASRLNEQLLKEHPNTACTFHQLGFVLLEIGHNEAALRAFEKAVHIRSGVLGVPVKDKACSYHKLGVAQLRTGDLKGALKSLQKASEIGSDPAFVDPINIASNCYWLGLVQLDLGMNKDALYYLKKAVDMRSKLMGETGDEETANAYHNLGIAQMRLDDFEALESLRKAANMFFLLFGDDKRTACSYHELGAMQLRKGDLTGALESVNEAFRMRSKLLGNYHRDTTESLSLINQINRELRWYHL